MHRLFSTRANSLPSLVPRGIPRPSLSSYARSLRLPSARQMEVVLPTRCGATDELVPTDQRACTLLRDHRAHIFSCTRFRQAELAAQVSYAPARFAQEVLSTLSPHSQTTSDVSAAEPNFWLLCDVQREELSALKARLMQAEAHVDTLEKAAFESKLSGANEISALRADLMRQAGEEAAALRQGLEEEKELLAAGAAEARRLHEIAVK
eukprot:scaffold171782_cov23-Tisochrysis_lutea.AAC.1